MDNIYIWNTKSSEFLERSITIIPAGQRYAVNLLWGSYQLTWKGKHWQLKICFQLDRKGFFEEHLSHFWFCLFCFGSGIWMWDFLERDHCKTKNSVPINHITFHSRWKSSSGVKSERSTISSCAYLSAITF